MVPRRGCWIGAFAIVMGLSCAAKSPEPKPTPPDMSVLVDSYEHPTLSLDPSNVRLAFEASMSVSASVQTAVELVPQIQTAVHAGLNADGDQKQIGASSNGSNRTIDVTGSGFLLVHRICPGTAVGGGPNEANGSIDLTIGFTERGIDPVVWGTFNACQFVLGGAPATVQGAVQMYVGENLTFDKFGTEPVLVAVDGALTDVSGTAGLAMDCRIAPTGAFEYRVFVGTQHVIYWDDLEQRGFRAANGTWTCQLDLHLCTRDEDSQQLAW
jgi:hypothetical protein